MSSVVAILLIIIALGMLIAYNIGYSIGHREGFDSGWADGKKEGSVRAYAVGYDRGRHSRSARESADSEGEEPPSRLRYLWPIVLSLILVVVATLVTAK